MIGLESSIFGGKQSGKSLYDEGCLSLETIEKYRINVDVQNDACVHPSYRSSGNQRKWIHDNSVLKLNCLGYEDIAEICCCWLLKYCKISAGYVLQYPCNIFNDEVFIGHGVIAENYLCGAEEVTFSEILKNNFTSFAIGYDEIIELIMDEYNVNVGDYIDVKTCLDAMTRNEDSHWGNFALLCEGSQVRTAPLFDFGDSCMADCISYPIDADFDACFKQLKAKPFRTNFEDQINPFCQRIALNYNAFRQSIVLGEHAEFNRAIRTIMLGLDKSKGIAWEEIA